MVTTGKDYDYVRNEMDMPRLRALSAYQSKFPPTNIGVQRLCRILEVLMEIDENSDNEQEEDEDNLLDDLNNLQQGF